jgi:hypothetical protein
MKIPSLKTCWQFLKNILQQKIAKQILSVLTILFSGAFIAYAVISNWNALRTQHWEIDFRYVLLAIFLYPAGMIPTVIAWHKLVQALGIQENFRTNLRIYSLSSLPRHIPGFVWFVTSRSMLYQERGVSTAITIAATVAETYRNLVAGVWIRCFKSISLHSNHFTARSIFPYFTSCFHSKTEQATLHFSIQQER